MSQQSETHNALCFGTELSPEGTPCHVDVTEEGVRVALPASGVEEVSFTRLTVDAGGFEHNQLVLKWSPDTLQRQVHFSDAGLILAFRRYAPPHLSEAVERTARGVRSTRRRRRGLLLAGLASVTVAILTMWFGFDAMVTVAVDRIPVDWERAIGEAAQREFVGGQTMVKTGLSVDAVNEIIHRLVDSIPGSPYTFQVSVVRNDAINAFALPGGYIVVFTGLMTAASGPDEVAGVLSHELSHVLLRHALKRVVKNLGLMAAVTIAIGDQYGMAGLARRVAIELGTLRFSRGQEIEADLAGLRLLYEARLSPVGLMAFFERLSAGDEAKVELLSTHPMSARRAERLKREAAALPPRAIVPVPVDWAAVQQSLK